MALLCFIFNFLLTSATLMYFQMCNQCYILRGTETNRLCYTILCIHWCRLPQISCFTHSLKCFSSDSDIYSNMGIGNPLQFFHPPKEGPVLQTLLFFPLVPSSYWVFVILFILFPLVRYSCQLSAGVPQALLCLKVYSWYVQGDRCTPSAPITLSSCSSQHFDYYK